MYAAAAVMQSIAYWHADNIKTRCARAITGNTHVYVIASINAMVKTTLENMGYIVDDTVQNPLHIFKLENVTPQLVSIVTFGPTH